ncbi:MAG: DNA (cytosine-5-)-methyltransferase [Chitinophagaceae bacterium]|nr:DNA (cytosine-5-)-methyltransferase [Chitinophagaceae bacterium]
MKHGSLFSGIGGFDLAAQNVGFNNIWCCEIDLYCQSILRNNFNHDKIYDDIVELSSPPYVDVLSGGFPCQDISNAKTWSSNHQFKANGIKGKRSGLWSEFARIIEEVKPKYVVIENVPALTKKGFEKVLYDLAVIGYDAEWTIISAAEFGAPHLRKRLWIVAYPIGFGRSNEGIIFSSEFRETISQSPKWESSRTICRNNKKKTLPKSFGIHDGVSRKLDDAQRIKGLGNAIVPDIAEFIFTRIKQHERDVL